MHLYLFDSLGQAFMFGLVFTLGTGLGQVVRDMVATSLEVGMRSIIYKRALKQMKEQQSQGGNN